MHQSDDFLSIRYIEWNVEVLWVLFFSLFSPEIQERRLTILVEIWLSAIRWLVQAIMESRQRPPNTKVDRASLYAATANCLDQMCYTLGVWDKFFELPSIQKFLEIEKKLATEYHSIDKNICNDVGHQSKLIN